MIAFYQHDLNYEHCRIRKHLPYRLHFHHHVELVYMFKGKCNAFVDGKEYTLKAGDILVVFPNQLHEYKTGEGEEFFICIFKPELIPDFKDIFYNMLPENNLYSTETNRDFFEGNALKISEVYASKNKYSDVIYKGLLSAFIGALLSEMELSKAKTADLSAVKSVLLYINENYLNDITLEDVANHLHLSKYYVSHLLNDKLKIGFNYYINSLRISEAVNMLEKGEADITEISRKCGFNTVRTFNRAFKRVYGIPPRKIQKNEGIKYIKKLLIRIKLYKQFLFFEVKENQWVLNSNSSSIKIGS